MPLGGINPSEMPFLVVFQLFIPRRHPRLARTGQFHLPGAQFNSNPSNCGHSLQGILLPILTAMLFLQLFQPVSVEVPSPSLGFFRFRPGQPPKQPLCAPNCSSSHLHAQICANSVGCANRPERSAAGAPNALNPRQFQFGGTNRLGAFINSNISSEQSGSFPANYSHLHLFVPRRFAHSLPSNR